MTRTCFVCRCVKDPDETWGCFEWCGECLGWVRLYMRFTTSHGWQKLDDAVLRRRLMLEAT